MLSAVAAFIVCCNKIHILCGVKWMPHSASPNACPQQETIDNTLSMGKKKNGLKVFLCLYYKNILPL